MFLGFKKNDLGVPKDKIRHIYDKKNHTWYFSIVDIIAISIETKDARNYWKVLKNRLKKQINNELVTKCNQLKLTSKDGKNYKTDTFTSNDILELIEIIAPKEFAKFTKFFEEIEGKKHTLSLSNELHDFKDNEEYANLLVDSFSNGKYFFVKFMTAGLSVLDIKICFIEDTLIITGKRENKNSNEDYFKNELFWGSFSKKMTLPFSINTDKFDAIEYRGMITLKFIKK